MKTYVIHCGCGRYWAEADLSTLDYRGEMMGMSLYNCECGSTRTVSAGRRMGAEMSRDLQKVFTAEAILAQVTEGQESPEVTAQRDEEEARLLKIAAKWGERAFEVEDEIVREANRLRTLSRGWEDSCAPKK